MQSSDLFNLYVVNVTNICRVCLEKGGQSHKLTPIFDPVKPPHFPNLIMSCASVQVAEGDGLPALICNKCIARLNVAYQFKQQCESSDAKLRHLFHNVHSLEADKGHHQMDASGIESQLQQEAGFQETLERQLLHQTQLDIKLESLPSIANEAVQVAAHFQDVIEDSGVLQLLEPCSSQKDEDDNYLVKKELGIGLVLANNKDLHLPAAEPVQPQVQPEPDKKPAKPQRQHQCDTCGKVFRTKPGLVHHIRIHTGERPYVCHLCDKRFINGGHLHTHMRTHTGEKNHVCAACSKAFATAQQLTKHTIAIHTSERPYACTYCPKRFASSSNLNTHTKIHTGEKNYRCEQCGKAFSTKGQLYQHMLVHTGEKAFLCEYCNKRFSQKAHLMRHLKMHR